MQSTRVRAQSTHTLLHLGCFLCCDVGGSCTFQCRRSLGCSSCIAAAVANDGARRLHDIGTACERYLHQRDRIARKVGVCFPIAFPSCWLHVSSGIGSSGIGLVGCCINIGLDPEQSQRHGMAWHGMRLWCVRVICVCTCVSVSVCVRQAVSRAGCICTGTECTQTQQPPNADLHAMQSRTWLTHMKQGNTRPCASCEWAAQGPRCRFAVKTLTLN